MSIIFWLLNTAPSLPSAICVSGYHATASVHFTCFVKLHVKLNELSPVQECIAKALFLLLDRSKVLHHDD
jgi:hypothetical protein